MFARALVRVTSPKPGSGVPFACRQIEQPKAVFRSAEGGQGTRGQGLAALARVLIDDQGAQARAELIWEAAQDLLVQQLPLREQAAESDAFRIREPLVFVRRAQQLRKGLRVQAAGR